MKTKTLREYINQLEELAKKLGDDTPVLYKCRYQFYGTETAYEPARKPQIINKRTKPKIVINPNAPTTNI